MNTAGLFIMIFSVGIVTVLFAWCLIKVFSQPPEEVDHLQATELHTPDMDMD